MPVQKYMLVAFGLLVAAVVIQLVAYALPYWANYGVNDTDYYFGLWDYCVSTTTCTKTADTSGLDTAWMRAVKAFASMALILLGSGLAALIVRMTCSDSIIVTIVASVLILVEVLFVIITLVVFGANADGVSTLVNFAKKLHAAFWLTMIGGNLALTAGIMLLCFACKRTKAVVDKVEKHNAETVSVH